MGSRQGENEAARAAFVRALDTLKREGSNVLVVGAGEPAHASACERLFGESNDDSRRRVLVTTGRHERSTGPAGDHGAVDVVVTYSSDADEDERGTSLGSDVVNAIDDLDDDVHLEPSRLRLCVESLDPLLTAQDPEDVFRLLHVVTTRVKRSNGMGHYHLTAERDDDDVRLLEPLFDAVLELRSDDVDVEQRWHLLGRDAISPWLPL